MRARGMVIVGPILDAIPRAADPACERSASEVKDERQVGQQAPGRGPARLARHLRHRSPPA